MPRKETLIFIAGCVGFIILANLFELIGMGLDWFAHNVPFGNEIEGLTIATLITWGVIKGTKALLVFLEGK